MSSAINDTPRDAEHIRTLDGANFTDLYDFLREYFKSGVERIQRNEANLIKIYSIRQAAILCQTLLEQRLPLLLQRIEGVPDDKDKWAFAPSFFTFTKQPTRADREFLTTQWPRNEFFERLRRENPGFKFQPFVVLPERGRGICMLAVAILAP